MAKSFNGYRSWNEWNVALWINNDSFLYTFAKDLKDKSGIDVAVDVFCKMFYQTPDKAKYNKRSVRNAIENL